MSCLQWRAIICEIFVITLLGARFRTMILQSVQRKQWNNIDEITMQTEHVAETMRMLRRLQLFTAIEGTGTITGKHCHLCGENWSLYMEWVIVFSLYRLSSTEIFTCIVPYLQCHLWWCPLQCFLRESLVGEFNIQRYWARYTKLIVRLYKLQRLWN